MLILIALAYGALVGALARLVLPGRQSLSMSATTLAGLLGAGTVGTAVAGATDGLTSWRTTSLVGSLLGAIVFVLIAEAINRRLQSRSRRRDTGLLLSGGEHATVEFKASARHNLHTGDKDPQVELAIARTVAGLGNAAGGTLLIGVADDGQVVGLQRDLQHVKGGDLDRYELWLHDLLVRCLGRGSLRGIHVAFEQIDDLDICRIDVAPAGRPLFLRPHTGERRVQLHARVGNSTRELAVDEAIDHVLAQWPQRLGRRRGRWATAGRQAP